MWIHADLLRPNLLVGGRKALPRSSTSAVPARAILQQMWFPRGPCSPAPAGETFRSALDIDDGTWNRARGYALHQAAMAISYYLETNPGFAKLGMRTLEQVLTDADC